MNMLGSGKGGKVLGYFCTYVPEEIYYAAGILPVRIMGGHEPPGLAERHLLSNVSCVFCRDALAQGLAKKYDYLDGVAIAQSCVHTVHAFWSWKKHIPLEYSHYLWHPWSTENVGRYEYLRGALAECKESVEKWIGRQITDEDLDRAIRVYNTNRSLIKQVYEFRKEDHPPLTGEEAMEMTPSSQLVDKEEHNQALEEFLEELPTRRLKRETGTRLMFVGSFNDDRRFIRMVEEEMTYSATFVVDDHCTGLRYSWNETPMRRDRLMALSIRYLNRPNCPNKDWPRRRRLPYLFHLFREWNAQAITLVEQKFCTTHQYDNPVIQKYFAEQGIPAYNLELD